MNEYFVTFGQRYRTEIHPARIGGVAPHPDGWVVVEASDLASAATAVQAVLGDRYAFLYEADDFVDGQHLYPLGELARIGGAA